MKKESDSKNVFIILGPTSTGKTSLALDLCRRFNGEIISADSRQVIKFMDVGTGKSPVGSEVLVEKKDMCWKVNGINIWGYDLVTPDEYFSGYDFAKFALKKVRDLQESKKSIFVVGGTGFYIDLFTGRIKPSCVGLDLELRSSLEDLPLESLQVRLLNLNPMVYKGIDKKNKVRLIRAIERETLRGLGNPGFSDTVLNYLSNESNKYNFIHLGLNGPRELLYKNSDAWVDAIWSMGLIEEVKALIDMGYRDSPKLQGLVYKTVLSFIDDKIIEKDAIQRIKYDIHSYIRRQMTWFKKNKEIKWVDISQDGYKKIIYNDIERKL